MPRKPDYDHVEFAQRPDSPYWQYRYYDPLSHKVQFRSTGTLDQAEAQRLLRDVIRFGGARMFKTNPEPKPVVLTVASALRGYYDRYACNIASAVQAKIAMRHLTSYYGALPVLELSEEYQ